MPDDTPTGRPRLQSWLPTAIARLRIAALHLPGPYTNSMSRSFTARNGRSTPLQMQQMRQQQLVVSPMNLQHLMTSPSGTPSSPWSAGSQYGRPPPSPRSAAPGLNYGGSARSASSRHGGTSPMPVQTTNHMIHNQDGLQIPGSPFGGVQGHPGALHRSSQATGQRDDSESEGGSGCCCCSKCVIS